MVVKTVAVRELVKTVVVREVVKTVVVREVVKTVVVREVVKTVVVREVVKTVVVREVAWDQTCTSSIASQGSCQTWGLGLSPERNRCTMHTSHTRGRRGTADRR